MHCKLHYSCDIERISRILPYLCRHQYIERLDVIAQRGNRPQSCVSVPTGHCTMPHLEKFFGIVHVVLRSADQQICCDCGKVPQSCKVGTAIPGRSQVPGLSWQNDYLQCLQSKSSFSSTHDTGPLCSCASWVMSGPCSHILTSPGHCCMRPSQCAQSGNHQSQMCPQTACRSLQPMTCTCQTYRISPSAHHMELTADSF